MRAHFCFVSPRVITWGSAVSKLAVILYVVAKGFISHSMKLQNSLPNDNQDLMRSG